MNIIVHRLKCEDARMAARELYKMLLEVCPNDMRVLNNGMLIEIGDIYIDFRCCDVYRLNGLRPNYYNTDNSLTSAFLSMLTAKYNGKELSTIYHVYDVVIAELQKRGREMIKNAQITSTMLGREDHGIMTFMIFVKFEGSSCGIGGYTLDQYDKDTNTRVFTAAGMEAISKILETVGVDRWEDLPSKYIRIKDNGWGKPIDEIGNLIENKWFNLREYFANVKEKKNEITH